MQRATPPARAGRHARSLNLSHIHYQLVGPHATHRSLPLTTISPLLLGMGVASAAQGSPENGHFEVEIPVTAEEVMTFSPTPSHSRAPPMTVGLSGQDPTETSPLLANKKERKPFYRPRPLWWVQIHFNAIIPHRSSRSRAFLCLCCQS